MLNRSLLLTAARLQRASRRYATSHAAGWSATTIVGKQPDAIVKSVRDALQTYRNSDALLFAISKTLPPNAVQAILALVKDISPIRVGCLSDALPFESNLGYELRDAVGLAALRLSQDERVTPFAIEEMGDAPVAVGRQVSSEMDANMPGRAVERPAWSGGTSAMIELPSELAGVDARTVNRLLFFSSSTPQQLLDTLASRFQNADMSGAIAAATPFATGRPHTLLLNERILSTGAVGLAISGSTSSPRTPPSVVYGPLRPLDGPVEARDVFGNIVKQLGGKPASHYLNEKLKGLQDAPDGPSAYDDKGGQVFLAFDVEQDRVLVPVNAGGQSRGSIAVDTTAALPASTMVQPFFRASVIANEYIPPIADIASFMTAPSIGLVSVPEEMAEVNVDSTTSTDEAFMLPNLCIVGSANGHLAHPAPSTRSALPRVVSRVTSAMHVHEL